MPTSSTEHREPTIPEAVKQLRLKLGDTQQQFAQRLGLAISTVVRYESTRPPRAEVLSRLYKLAIENGLRDVAEMFMSAIHGEISGSLQTGYSPLEQNERAIAAAIVGLLRNCRTLPELRKPCQAALKGIAKGYRLTEKRHEAGTMIFAPHEELKSDEFWAAVEAFQKTIGNSK